MSLYDIAYDDAVCLRYVATGISFSKEADINLVTSSI